MALAGNSVYGLYTRDQNRATVTVGVKRQQLDWVDDEDDGHWDYFCGKLASNITQLIPTLTSCLRQTTEP